MRRLLAALGGAALAGCASISSVQSADTLGEGNFQVGVEPGLWVATPINTPLAGVLLYPHGDVAFRYGLTEQVDIGARAGSSMIELQSKFLFTDPAANVKVSFAPTASFFLATELAGAPGFTLNLPVLVGIPLGRRLELVLGPRVQNTVLILPGSFGYQVGLGSSVGVQIRVARYFAVLPEVAVSFPTVLVGQTAEGVGAAAGVGFFQFQFKLGVLIGPSRAGNAFAGSAPPDEVPPPAPAPPEQPTPAPPPPPIPGQAPTPVLDIPRPPPPPN